MKYIKGTENVQITESTAVTIGKFDGIHKGHQLLLQEVFKQQKQGLLGMIFTFDVAPNSILFQQQHQVLTTREEKVMLFQQEQMDVLVEYPFTEEIRKMKPEEFLRMLQKKFSMKVLIVGHDFCFGYERTGNRDTLKELAKNMGFEAIILKKKQYKGQNLGSTAIKEAIQNGRMKQAEEMLGRPYFVTGEIVHGRQLGRTLGIPTINQIPPKEKLLPPFGVYAARVFLEGKTYYGIANIGKKPTIEGENPVGVETHIFDFFQDVYGKNVRVELLKFLREEQKFHSVEQLKKRMEQDIVMVRKMLHEA